jgi:NAD(P)-dependent dehydrogenase (short-subunit alcohol dehydrogenase family)
MTLPSNQRVALVTGCSEPHSLGAALARALLVKGFVVYATARNVGTMEGLAAEGCKVSVVLRRFR